MAEVAAGAACPIIVRSCSTIGRRLVGCLAKNPSTGAPRSLRGAGFDVAAAGLLPGLRAGALDFGLVLTGLGTAG
jgi:hypothetical protein